MSIELSKQDKYDILGFVGILVLCIFAINFLAKNQSQFKDCEIKALGAGYPDYSYITDTKQCFGKNETKSELLYYYVDKK
jgi:hypothetical protein